MAAYVVRCESSLPEEDLRAVCQTYGSLEVTGKVVRFSNEDDGKRFREDLDGVDAEGLGRFTVIHVPRALVRNVTSEGMFYCDLCREWDIEDLSDHKQREHHFDYSDVSNLVLKDCDKKVLGEKLLRQVSFDKMTADRWERVRHLHDDLNNVLGTHEASLIPFGSCQQYLNNASSDVDFALNVSSPSPDVLAEVHELLCKVFPKNSLTLMTSARVPVIKYTPRNAIPFTATTSVQLMGPDGPVSCDESAALCLVASDPAYSYLGALPWYPFSIPFDISLDTRGVLNSRLIRNYITQCPVTAWLCMLAKSFCKKSGVIAATRGMLTSYATVLLVIFYGVEHGLLRHVSTAQMAAADIAEKMVEWREEAAPQPELLAEHWTGFLKYYVLNIDHVVVTLRDQELNLGCSESIKDWKAVQVIDPYVDLNLGRGIGALRVDFIKDALCKELRAVSSRDLKGSEHYYGMLQNEDTCKNWLLLAEAIGEENGCSKIGVTERQALGIAASMSPTARQLVDILLHLDRIGTAYNVYPKVLQQDPFHVVALLRRGVQLGKKGRHYFMEVLNRTTDSVVYAAALGNVGMLMEAGDLVDVKGMTMSKQGVLCKAIETAPGTIPLWKELCRVVAEDEESDEVVVSGVAFTRVRLFSHVIELQTSCKGIAKSANEEFLLLAKQLHTSSSTTVVSGKEVGVPTCLKAVYKLTGKPVPNGTALFTSKRPTDTLTQSVLERGGEPFIKAKLSHVHVVTALVACFDASDDEAMGMLESVKVQHPKLVVVVV